MTSPYKAIANQLKKKGYRILATSDGLIGKQTLVNPCIVFAEIHMPKTRFNNEKSFTKDFFRKVGKKKFVDLTGDEMSRYNRLIRKQGETAEYKKWIKNYAIRANKKIYALVDKFNKISPVKIPTIEKLSLLRFEDSSLRLGFGNQYSRKEFDNKQKYPIAKKRQMLKSMEIQANQFSKFLKRNS